MSMMKRVLEVIEADDELKTAYKSTLKTFEPESEEYDEMMQWLYCEALDELKN